LHSAGFLKERIKINFVSSSRIVRVTGERPLVGNRISRFEQTYPVPEYCEKQKLQGKFEQGTLTITMPKKAISQVLTPKAEIEPSKIKRRTPVSPLTKPMPESKPKEEPKQTSPPKSLTTRIEQEKKDPIGDKERPQNVQEETEVKSPTTTSTTTIGPIKQIEDNREEEIRQKAMEYIETVKKKLHEMDDKKSVTKKEDEAIRKPGKYIDNNMVLKDKEIKTRISPKEGESSSPKVKEKGKENTIDKAKSKEDESYTIGKGIKEVVASASEVVTKIGEGTLNEQEKPLVANMGAAILVIVALGAYVTYKFTSSGRA